MHRAVFLMLLPLSGPAYASGGLSCKADDKSAAFAIEGGITRGMGSPLFSLEGRVEIRSEDVPQDLRVTTFKHEHVAQYWLDATSLNLRLYREREGDEPHGFVELAVMSRAADDEGTYRGSYELTVYDTNREAEEIRLEGSVLCVAE